jgi:hypothetical protein
MRIKFVGNKGSVEIDGLLAIELLLWEKIICKIERLEATFLLKGPHVNN